MNINCNIAGDLMPLYLDSCCCEDSSSLLEEHMRHCPACTEKLRRMKNEIASTGKSKDVDTVHFVDCGRKIRRRRVRTVILTVLCASAAALILLLVYLTILDMHAVANPSVHEVESGTYNLTSGGLTADADDISKFTLYTNNTTISVTVQSDNEFQGTIMLWNAKDKKGYIQIAEIESRKNTAEFTGLSASNRYIITCSGLNDALLTVSDGRQVSFWQSFKSVLNEFIPR